MTKTDKLIRSTKRSTEFKTPISSGMFLPNHSGSQRYNRDRVSAWGSMYLHEANETIAMTKDNYTHLTGFTAGESHNIDVTGDEFVIIKPGTYIFNWSVSSKCSSANQTIDLDMFVDGVEHNDGSARRSYGTANTLGNVGGTAIITLEAGNSVDIRAKNTTSDADIVLFAVNLTGYKIAE